MCFQWQGGSNGGVIPSPALMHPSSVRQSDSIDGGCERLQLTQLRGDPLLLPRTCREPMFSITVTQSEDSIHGPENKRGPLRSGGQRFQAAPPRGNSGGK